MAIFRRMKNISQRYLFNDINDDDFHYLEVTNNLEEYDKDYVIDIVFKYFRSNGLTHYKIEEGEKRIQKNK